MRNNAPINYFPPTPFSPERSPIYGEAHFYRAQAGWVLTTGLWTTGPSGKSRNAETLKPETGQILTAKDLGPSLVRQPTSGI
jgi:hypothetical protein